MRKDNIKHQANRFRAHISKMKGTAGEITFKTIMIGRGHNIKKTGVGSDFSEGRKRYEIKVDSSRLSKRQQKEQKRLGSKYVVVRFGSKKRI